MISDRAPFRSSESEKRSKILKSAVEFDKHFRTTTRNVIERDKEKL